MSDSFYCRIQVKALPRFREEEFTAFCFDYGAQGVTEELDFVQPDAKYEPQVVEADTCRLSVFFADMPSEDFFLRVKDQFPEAEVIASVEENKDWLEEWKKGFRPFLFVDPFWIVPSWHETPKEAKFPLYVDPGMAFGTGTHETTRLAARLLLKAMESTKAEGKAAPSLLDVGTGTGILAIVGVQLGARPAIAIDNDPEARRVARENIALNKTPSISVPDDNLEDIRDQFDIVVANIIDGVLLDIKSDLLRALKPGGRMVLSGILRERAESFTEKFLQDTTLTVRERLDDGEWVGLLLS